MFSTNSFSKNSFSMNAFKQSQAVPGDCKFWADGFWSDGFWLNGFWCEGRPKLDAKSGYWRLFYYNLQEEALKKDEQVKGKAAEKGEGESEKAKPVAAKKPKPKPKPRPIEVLEPIPHLPKPIYRKAEAVPSSEFGDLLAQLRIEFSTWQFALPILSAQLLSRQAANDEEDDIEMLLLAA